MSKRKGGSRAGSRKIFRKHPRMKGKISMTKFFTPYTVGDRVILSAEPAVQKNLYHQRFHSKKGFVTGKRGDCYEISIKDGGHEKMLIIHPIHMRKLL